MKKCEETLGKFYEKLCDAQYLAQELNHPCLNELAKIRESVGQDVLKDMYSDEK